MLSDHRIARGDPAPAPVAAVAGSDTGYAFNLLKDLRQIDRRAAYFGSDLGQGPASRQIARQHEFDAIHQSLPSYGGPCSVCGARPQSPRHKSQGQTFSFQRFGSFLSQTVPEQRHQRLSARIDSQALTSKCEPRAIAQQAQAAQFRVAAIR